MKKKHQWRAIIFCISGAVIFWLFNALHKTYVTEVRYPISFIFDSDTVVFEDLPHEITLELTGNGWNLLRNSLHMDVSLIQITLANPTEIAFVTGKQLYPSIAAQLSRFKINRVIMDTLYLAPTPKSENS